MFKTKQKWIGIGLVAVAVLISGYVTFFKHGRGGLELLNDRAEASSMTNVVVPEEMKALTDLYRTINLVQKRYIDAGRIDPKAMFIGALKAIQLNVARVMVVEGENQLSVKIASREKQFDLTDLKTPWVLLQRIKEVFTFIKEEVLEDGVDLNEVEYAAINGMLKTLDPHSVFLNPDQYREMKDKTHGNFAGLGIVISIRDGVLTIISPIDGTPADVAGLEAGDQIIKIDDESTVNMSLNDAVDLLRGDPGTRVTVHILRKGWAAPKPFSIVRAIVKVESLETHLLTGKVGYVRIKDFQGNTADDIQETLDKWQKRGIRGLVLDLRGCPGGLLEASVQVSDLFLKQGVIVTTAGQSPGDRDIRRAVDSGEEPDYPIVVIVDQGSASASEILAGALKNHGRALVVGERTFGKGSVQVLFEFQENDLPTATTALKLTTAQYLTPGDISIQSVGVVPHIGLFPMRADEEMIDLKIDGGYREADLSHHFEVAHADSEAEKPRESLSYLWTPPKIEKKEGEEEGEDALPIPEKDKPFEPDFVIGLARDFVAKMNPETTKIDDSVFDTLSGLLGEKRKIEEKRLVNALRKLGIDWQAASHDEVAAVADISLNVNDKAVVKAGDEATLTVSVKNNGPGTFYRLAATSQSDFRPFDDRELAFGKVGPSETVTRTLTFPVPKDALAEINDILWTFDGEGAPAPDPVAIRFEVDPLDRPQFAYKYHIDDTKKGNSDGVIQVGESVDLVLEVKNVGKGTSLNTYATLKSLSDKSLFLIRGREPMESLPPNEIKNASFAFEIKPEFAEESARFELAVADVDLREYLVDKLSIPVYPVNGGKTESALRQDANGTDFNATPLLVIDDVTKVTRGEKIRISGTAKDESHVRDIFIFVDDNKVFFKSNDPKKGAQDTLTFEAELPLKKGINYITIVAEESNSLQARRIVAVRRDRADHMPFLLSRTSEDVVNPLGVLPQNSSAFNASTTALENSSPLTQVIPAPGTGTAAPGTGTAKKPMAAAETSTIPL